MPTYEYQCKVCGYDFEVFQNMADEPLKVCPQCGREVRRVINGGGGVIFKGSGFYVTDKSKGTGKNSEKTGDPSGAKTPAPCASCPNAASGACAAAPPPS
ncbi:MAG: zinc ribbon domain-containing protein [Spirochaetaceae bacterium]|jgi:putative FmdB family regulatory protein|nr:zinc ribbon domain-containing protein [Spirochaetaceae bacterium]